MAYLKKKRLGKTFRFERIIRVFITDCLIIRENGIYFKIKCIFCQKEHTRCSQNMYLTLI